MVKQIGLEPTTNLDSRKSSVELNCRFSVLMSVLYQVFEGPDNGGESVVRDRGRQDAEQVTKDQRVQFGRSEIRNQTISKNNLVESSEMIISGSLLDSSI